MTEVLVSIGVQKLWELLSQEYEQFRGVEDQVAELKSDLNLLKPFLKDADAKKHTSALVRSRVQEIKEIVYDAEDVIEAFLLKEKLGKTSGIKKRIRRLACIVPDRREIALYIGGISKRVSKVIRDMQSFGVQQIIADGYMQPLLHDREKAMRQTFCGENESDLVGLDENVDKLVGYLKRDNVQVVSITGMGGLGKTTLARQAFNHEDVTHHFDGLTWVCVSQEFKRKNVWQTILQNLTPSGKKDEILQMTEDTLQGELFELLETSKSLIVFDDIWKEEDWDLIKPIFPPKKGWKVLITSRYQNVGMRRDETYINFKPECLSTEDSWTLFQRVAMPRKDASEFKVDEEMEEMGKQMIKHCGGLPLAVRVLGGLLAAKYTWHDWKRVSENIGSRILGGTNIFSDDNNIISVDRVLSLSFEELPSYLKHCFLYLAHFPEDYPIRVERLSYYWAAEGIPKPRHCDGETIRDVGDSYIEELVRRNMVIAERDIKTLRFETCHLHDMTREVCLLKAKEENFLQIDGIPSPNTNFQSRRFVWQNPTTLDVERDINNPKLRSLLIVFSGWEKWTPSGLNFTKLQLLRVLDLARAEFEGGKLPSSIGKLIHLRYLSLQWAEVSHLPSSLGNLKLLIYLNLYVSYHCILFVPNVLMGMQELRYLELPRRMHEKTKLELSNLDKLETLRNFNTDHSSLKDLHGMTRLRTLEIRLTKESSIETLSASIGGLRHLEYLRINDDHDRSIRKIEKGFLFNSVHLKQLELYIYMPRLFDEQRLPSHLTTISLTGCRLEEDPMPILEKLLHLKEVGLWRRSFSGRRMVCSGGGFPQLRMLSFSFLEKWEEWIVEEGSMPLLHTLSVGHCEKLKELPDGLRFITSLKDLTNHSMGEEWKKRLSKGGEDYYKIQHIPSVTFYGKE